MSNVFQQPHYPGAPAVYEADSKGDIDTLRELVVGAALYEEDRQTAEAICRQFSKHQDEIVRGNAILGVGHLSRLFREISEDLIAIVAAGLTDPSEYVRGQADAAAEDVEFFLGRSIVG